MAPVSKSTFVVAVCVFAAASCSAFNIGGHHHSVGKISLQSPVGRLSTSVRSTKAEMEKIMADMTEEEKEEFKADVERTAKKLKYGTTSPSGVKYAPWMDIDEEAVQMAIAARKSEVAQRKKSVRGALAIDPQAGELSGLGLKTKLMGDEVQLSWSTSDETNNVGFIVQRRRGGQEEFDVIASYEDWAPLNTKGPKGGDYSFVDDSGLETGSWVYRISDCDTAGNKNDICQALVEIEDESSVLVNKVALVAGIALFGGLLALGLILDPESIAPAPAGI
eukprot:CAMPEP_0113934476 /NCGR_PEP_ID=MMETSP1339-20121228/1802_1 /TAXON_ID=94617 /ORGANISM="Fibrocapsa japonica" /LENGTH=277 /DNA_ID=CAMNT_0000936295 /DNA_START=69 /DNA_END=902 /DNA_ORIENTATION=- /assembly_acc=CAM_ASM_000762